MRQLTAAIITIGGAGRNVLGRFPFPLPESVATFSIGVGEEKSRSSAQFALSFDETQLCASAENDDLETHLTTRFQRLLLDLENCETFFLISGLGGLTTQYRVLHHFLDSLKEKYPLRHVYMAAIMPFEFEKERFVAAAKALAYISGLHNTFVVPLQNQKLLGWIDIHAPISEAMEVASLACVGLFAGLIGQEDGLFSTLLTQEERSNVDECYGPEFVSIARCKAEGQMGKNPGQQVCDVAGSHQADSAENTWDLGYLRYQFNLSMGYPEDLCGL